MAIKYALFPNHLTSDPDDYMAIVQDQDSKDKEAIIDEMIGRGSTVTKAEALSVLEEFEAAVERALDQGHSINTPLFRISASIKGVFYEQDHFDKSKHYVKLNVTPGARIGEIAEKLAVEKVDAKAAVPFIQNFKDIASDTTNEIMTPKGVGEITGSRLKIDESDPAQGIFFIDVDGKEKKSETLIRNKPANLIFMLPTGLAKGPCTVEVRAVYKNNKELRIGRLSSPLQIV